MHGGDCYRNEVNMDFSINVNPLGIPEEIADAMQQSLTQAMVYPDPQCQALRQAIGGVYQKDAACIVCGNGASDLLLAFARAFMPKKALLPVPGFSGYAYALKSIGCHVALFDTKEDEDFALSEAFLDRIRSEAPDLVILTNPGNPSGHMLSQEFLTKVAWLCRHMNIRLLIDECFIELTGEGKDNSFLKASSGTKNIFILQALTKSMAIPGIRLGYLFCPKEQDAKKVQEQVSEWNVSVIAQRAGIAGMQVLADGTYLSQTRQLLERERAYLTQSLQEIGAKVYPGTANFLLFYEDSIDWYAACFAVLAIPGAITLILLLVTRRKFPNPEHFEPEPREYVPFHMKKEFLLYIGGISLFAFGFIDYSVIIMHVSRTFTGVAAGLQETGSLISGGTLPLLYAGAMLVDAVAALFFGLLYDRKGVRALVWSTLLSAPFAIFVFAGHSVASLLVGIALWGVGMGAQESILKAAVSSMVPKTSRATGYGVFECAFGVFWFLGSWLLGVLYDRSIPAMIVVSVAAQLAAIPLYIASSRRIKANP